MSAHTRTRAFLFYMSVAVFFTTLPAILSYSLGFKFDARTLTFYRTGLIALKSQPEGADVYLDGKPLNDRTPVTINELSPGAYQVEVRLKGYYPWSAKINVASARVANFERITLFPLRPEIKQLNKEKLTAFYVDQGKDRIYYFDQERSEIYVSDVEGNNQEKVGDMCKLDAAPLQCKVSPARKKIAYYNQRQVGISYLYAENDRREREAPCMVEVRDDLLREVFWHSNDHYLILVTDKKIEARELRPDASPMVLVVLNRKDARVFYDAPTDTLYFQDAERAADGRMYDNVYALELKQKLFDLRSRNREKGNPDE